MDKFKEYSRVPIYDDNIDNIVGVVLTKEYFYEYINDNLDDKSDIIKPVSTINENIPIGKLLDIFLSKKEHMCIVLDSYDQTEGIVTLEDVLETLLGREIVDELDSTIDMRELAKLTKR
jgi:CBS domain containing-hemolysin-like protein